MLAAGFSRFTGCLSLSSCHLLAFLLSALSLRFLPFSSAIYPLRVFVGPSSLLRRWLSSLGASLPLVLCLAAALCDSCRIHLPLFLAAFFFLSGRCHFLFFTSAVSFCRVLLLFFLCWYTILPGVFCTCLRSVSGLLHSHALLFTTLCCLESLSLLPFSALFLSCPLFTCLFWLVGGFPSLGFSLCAFFLPSW